MGGVEGGGESAGDGSGGLTGGNVVEAVGPIDPLVDLRPLEVRGGGGVFVERAVAAGSDEAADGVALEDAALGSLQHGDLWRES